MKELFEFVKKYYKIVGGIIGFLTPLIVLVITYPYQIMNILNYYYIDLLLILGYIISVLFILYKKDFFIYILRKIKLYDLLSNKIISFITLLIILLSISYLLFYYYVGLKVRQRLIPQMTVINASLNFKKGNYQKASKLLEINSEKENENYLNKINKIESLKKISINLYEEVPLYSYQKLKTLNLLYKLSLKKNQDMNLNYLEKTTNPKINLVANFYKKYKKEIEKNDKIFNQALTDIKKLKFNKANKTLSFLAKKYPENIIFQLFAKEVKDILNKKTIQHTILIKELQNTNNISEIRNKYSIKKECYDFISKEENYY